MCKIETHGIDSFRKTKKLHIQGLALMQKLSHATLEHSAEQMSSALGINTHRHGSEPSLHRPETMTRLKVTAKKWIVIIYSPSCHLQEFDRFTALFIHHIHQAQTSQTLAVIVWKRAA